MLQQVGPQPIQRFRSAGNAGAGFVEPVDDLLGRHRFGNDRLAAARQGGGEVAGDQGLMGRGRAQFLEEGPHRDANGQEQPFPRRRQAATELGG